MRKKKISPHELDLATSGKGEGFGLDDTIEALSPPSTSAPEWEPAAPLSLPWQAFEVSFTGTTPASKESASAAAFFSAPAGVAADGQSPPPLQMIEPALHFGEADPSRALSKGSSAATPKQTSTGDGTAPTLAATALDTNSTGVDPNIVLTFSEPITAGRGKITIKGGGQTLDIPVTDLNQVSISGSTLRIDPSVALLPNTTYSVSLAAGTVKDLAGNSYAGGTTQVSGISSASPVMSSWTVMIYIAADNDLESFSISDLNELEAAYTKQFGAYDYNFVVLADRSPNYSTASGNWSDTRIGAISYDASADVVSPLKSVGELNTGEGGTLSQFVSWTTGVGWTEKYAASTETWGAAGEYKADNYGLVIWNHGAGLDGIAWDYTSKDHLTIPELSTAIDSTGVQFGFIGFDACLMSMAEIVYDASDNAQFVVGSQDLEPGNGWAYDDWLRTMDSQLTAGKHITAANMVTSAVNTFAAEYPRMKGIALSAVEGAEMPALIRVLNSFTSKVVSESGAALANPTDVQVMTSAAESALEFGGGSYEFIDLGQFMAQVAGPGRLPCPGRCGSLGGGDGHRSLRPQHLPASGERSYLRDLQQSGTRVPFSRSSALG